MRLHRLFPQGEGPREFGSLGTPPRHHEGKTLDPDKNRYAPGKGQNPRLPPFETGQ